MTMFPEFTCSRILIHVAFHFVEKRLQYLESVIKEFGTYAFSNMTVVIDTNTAETIPYIEKISSGFGYKPEVHVHEELEHPFDLTWVHRSNMESRLQDYDYFMYLEDDILIPYACLERWREDSQKIHNRGYIRSFLRVDRTEDGTLVSTDHKRRIRHYSIIRIDDVDYVQPWNPYHACWIYDSLQMEEFLGHPFWQQGDCPWKLKREKAAYGMIWSDSHQHRHRALIPISATRQPLKESLIYHVPNTYALDPKTRYGNIPVNKLFAHYTGFSNYLSDLLYDLLDTKAAILEAVAEGSLWYRVRSVWGHILRR